MAFRNLLRHRRRSFFSAFALALGLALLVIMAAFLAGEFRQSMENSIRLQSGHLQVRALTYDENKGSLKWENLIENPDALAAQIASLPQVTVATPRLFASGIVTIRNESVGVQVIGIDPPSPANDPYRNGLVSGQFLSADDREGILIGQPLADKLKLQVGETIVLLVNTSNGDVNQQNFAIRGIYTTQTMGYDQSTVFLPLAKAQAISQTENHASTIFILLKDRELADAVAASLQSSIYQIKTWRSLNSLIVDFEAFANAYMVILYMIVLGVTATVIINTLIMSVFERIREIGILSALGMKGRSIMTMFFMESSLLAIGGIVMGLILGLLSAEYLAQTGFYIGKMGITGILIGDTIYPYINLNDSINLTILAFIVTLLAALYPAIIAARMEPVEALHAQ